MRDLLYGALCLTALVAVIGVGIAGLHLFFP